MAVLWWDDEAFRRMHIILANLWWAAAFVAERLERRVVS
jgi:hypothetical protein